MGSDCISRMSFASAFTLIVLPALSAKSGVLRRPLSFEINARLLGNTKVAFFGIAAQEVGIVCRIGP